MIPTAPTRNSGSSLPAVAILVLLAVGAGLCCVVLPPYLIQGSIKGPAYGWPLIPWFAIAFANLQFTPTMLSLFGLGILLGAIQPRWWWLLGVAAISLPPVLHAINMVHDWTIDPTSHNLFPFEFAIYAFIAAPAPVGALLGLWLKRLSQKAGGA